jgi:hypothetical protein
MTDFAAEPAERRAPIHARHQNLILIVAGVVMALIAAGIIYSFATKAGGDKVMAQIKADAQGQLQTQDVSCRKLGFSVPTLTKQPIYTCDAKNVALLNRPNGHIHDSAFTRCYLVAVNGQTVDISHAIYIEAKMRGKTLPCR